MAKKGTTAPMDAALNYLTSRARTVREMELYLDSKQYGEYEVYSAVERLKELGYLDDEKYAADFISSRLASKPVSRRKLKDQLYNHKLPKDVIDEALKAVTDEMENQNAKAVAEKFYRMFMALPDDERRERVMKRLVARGYGYDAISKGVESLLGCVEERELSAFEYETDTEE